MKFLGAFVFLFLALVSQSQAGSSTFIWQGFTHSWGYNHRLNRFGDFIASVDCVTAASCTAEHRHTAASGTGPDHSSFQSAYAFVHAPGVAFLAGSVELRLEGKEGETISKRQVIAMDVPQALAGRLRYEALLNGFDLMAAESADMVGRLKLGVDEVAYDSVARKLQFAVNVELNFACETPECPRKDNSVDYRLRVAFVIAGGGKGFETVEQKFTRREAWTKRDTPGTHHEAKYGYLGTLLPERFAGVPLGRPHVFAFKEFTVALDTHHHFKDWTSILVQASQADERDISVKLGLNFNQWSFGMKKAHPPTSYFSFRDGGQASWTARVVALLFPPDSRVRIGAVSGELDWAGYGASPNAPESVLSTVIH